MPKYFLILTLLLTVGAGCLKFTSEPNEPFIELEPSEDYYINPDKEPVVTPEPEEQPNEDVPPTSDQPICENVCGNGTCEEIVCLGTGCPCAESVDSCPQDCSERSP